MNIITFSVINGTLNKNSVVHEGTKASQDLII